VFGIGEAADVGEDGEGGRGNDRADAGDRLQAAERLREGHLLLRQRRLERRDLLTRTAAERAVLRDVHLQCLEGNVHSTVHSQSFVDK